MRRFKWLLALTFVASAHSSVLAAQTLNVLCSAESVWCQAMALGFERKTGIKVAMARKSTGEVLAQISAEKDNPKIDLWFGGTGDPHMQAAEQGLTLSYRSSSLPQLHDWARRQAEQSNYRTVGVYVGALVIAYNTELIKKKKLPVPACWKDLLKHEYKDEIQVADPNSSGTAYTAIATFVQIMGEEEAFKYLKALHQNVNQYPRIGAAPLQAVSRGETTIAISFMQGVVLESAAGFPVKAALPCEGTGYEIGSMSIIKGARNIEVAKAFYEWQLTAEGQKLALQTRQYYSQLSNRNAPLYPDVPTFAEMKLIDYDVARFGRGKERMRLIARWNREINTAK